MLLSLAHVRSTYSGRGRPPISRFQIHALLMARGYGSTYQESATIAGCCLSSAVRYLQHVPSAHRHNKTFTMNRRDGKLASLIANLKVRKVAGKKRRK